jgi:hypothetical protein
MFYEESVSHFKTLEILEKIKCTNGPIPAPIPLENKKSFDSSVGKSSNTPNVSTSDYAD